jgi:altronate dehydratase small subunit
MKALLMDSKDNVAVVLQNVSIGQELEILSGRNISNVMTATENIPFCHKIALNDISSGENIVKYGEIIGKATKPISHGEHVHIHNVVSIRGSSSKQ